MWKAALQRSWQEGNRLYDAFFAYGQGGLNAFRQVLREILTFVPSAPVNNKKKKPTFLPQLEGLEIRQMPTTVQFSGSAYSIAESAASITMTATLDASSSQDVTVHYASANSSA